MRYRISFSKTEAMRYTSHLDLQRTWERTIRRAGLPLTYSQGFNPHPKLNLATALPLGITSECELLDIWLDEDLDADEVNLLLRDSVPAGIKVNQVAIEDLHAPKLPTLINSVCYRVTLLDDIPKLKERINRFLSASSIIRERRGKTYDLRPLINEFIMMPENEKGQQQFRISLRNRPGETGRPDEVLSTLNINPFSAVIHRMKIILKEN